MSIKDSDLVLARIAVTGCDDVTVAFIMMTAAELATASRIASEVTKASSCECQPVMGVRLADARDSDEIAERAK